MNRLQTIFESNIPQLSLKQFMLLSVARQAKEPMNFSRLGKILGCSRQNIIDLTKRGKLHPIKTSEKSTLYLKSEVLKRNWQ